MMVDNESPNGLTLLGEDKDTDVNVNMDPK